MTRFRAAALFSAFLVILAPTLAFAVDLGNPDWSETDSSNAQTPPAGWPAGMAPNQVEPTARAMMGALKRWYDSENATQVSGGTANAQTLTYAVAPAAYYTGQCFLFIVGPGLTNTAAPTLNVNSLGAIAIYNGASTISAGQLAAGAVALVCYDGTHFQLLSANGTSPAQFTGTNILFNGSMNIDQANEGSAVALTSGTPAYIEDGWKAAMHSGTAAITCNRQPDAPSGFTYSLLCTTGTGAAPAAGDYLGVYQPIEAANITPIGFGASGAQSICVSFRVKSSIAPYTGDVVLQNAAQTRSYVEDFSIPTSGLWTTISQCFAADTGGTWVTSGSNAGAILGVFVAAGSGVQGTNKAWASADEYGSGSITNTLLSTNGAFFEITGVKLEINTAATPYVAKSRQQELDEAQRYYQKSYDVGVVPGSNTAFYPDLDFPTLSDWPASSVFNIFVPFPEQMRCDPTVTLYTPSGTSGEVDLGTMFAPTASTMTAIAAGVTANGIMAIKNNGSQAGSNIDSIAFNYTADCRL